MSPLHLASKGGYQQIVKLLIEKECDINAKDDELFCE